MAKIKSTLSNSVQNFLQKLCWSTSARILCQLVSEALSPDAYAALTERVGELHGHSFVGIKTCNSILTDLHLGQIMKYKNITDIKTMTKNGSLNMKQRVGHF